MLELIKKAKANSFYMEKVVKKFTPLITKAARHYTYDNEMFFDALSEGQFALIKCVEKYPLDSKIPFPYYAKRYVYSHIRSFASKEINSLDNLVSIQDKVLGCDDITIEDTISSGDTLESEFFKRFDFLEILDAIANLKFIERQTIERYYFLNHSLKQIAKDLDYSYRGIKYAKSRGIEKIRDRFL